MQQEKNFIYDNIIKFDVELEGMSVVISDNIVELHELYTKARMCLTDELLEITRFSPTKIKIGHHTILFIVEKNHDKLKGLKFDSILISETVRKLQFQNHGHIIPDDWTRRIKGHTDKPEEIYIHEKSGGVLKKSDPYQFPILKCYGSEYTLQPFNNFDEIEDYILFKWKEFINNAPINREYTLSTKLSHFLVYTHKTLNHVLTFDVDNGYNGSWNNQGKERGFYSGKSQIKRLLIQTLPN